LHFHGRLFVNREKIYLGDDMGWGIVDGEMMRLTVAGLFSEHKPVPPAQHRCRSGTGCWRRPAAVPEAASVQPLRQLPQGCWLLISASLQKPRRVTN